MARDNFLTEASIVEKEKESDGSFSFRGLLLQEKRQRRNEEEKSGGDMSNYEVDEETRKETVKCSEDFACLNGDSECICDIENSFNGKVIFIKPCSKLCSYRMSFGYSYICNCPTRKYIYRRYNR